MIVEPALVLQGGGERNRAQMVIAVAAQGLNLKKLIVLDMLQQKALFQNDTGGLHIVFSFFSSWFCISVLCGTVPQLLSC